MIPLTAIILTILLINFLSPFFEREIKIQVAGNEYRVNHILYYFLLMLPLYILYAFQYAESADYYNYSVMFNKIRIGIKCIDEPIIYSLFKLIAVLKLNFQFVYLALYAIVFIILYKCLKDYSANFGFSLIISTCILFTLFLHQIRQLLAVVICFYAYRYILSKSIIKYYICILLACGCHLSAVIMVPAYFVLRYKFKLTDTIVLSGFCVAIGVFAKHIFPIIIKTFFPDRINWYNNFQESVINKWESILLVVFLMIILLFISQAVKKEEINQVFCNAFIIYVILFFLGRWIPEVTRWGYYYFLPSVALIPNCLAEEKNIKYKQLYCLFLTLYLLVYLFLRFQVQLSLYSIRFFY